MGKKTYEELEKQIADLTKQNEILSQGEQKSSDIFISMSEMFQVIELIYDDNGKAADYYYREVNPAFERLVGKTNEQLINNRAKELFGIVENYWLETYEKVDKKGISTRFENYGAELNKYYEIYAWKVAKNQIAIIFNDITK